MGHTQMMAEMRASQQKMREKVEGVASVAVSYRGEEIVHTGVTYRMT